VSLLTINDSLLNLVICYFSHALLLNIYYFFNYNMAVKYFRIPVFAVTSLMNRISYYSVERRAYSEEKRKEGNQNKFVSHITLGSSFVIEDPSFMSLPRFDKSKLAMT